MNNVNKFLRTFPLSMMIILGIGYSTKANAGLPKCIAFPEHTGTGTSEVYYVVPNPGASPVPVATAIPISSRVRSEGSAYRPLDQTHYGFREVSGVAVQMVSVNLSTGAVTNVTSPVATLNEHITAAEFATDYAANKDYLYILTEGGTNGRIYQLDPDNNYSIVSSSDITGSTNPPEGLAWDPKLKIMYASTDRSSPDSTNTNQDIWRINLTTGQLTFVSQSSIANDGESLSYAADGLLYTEDDQSSGPDYIGAINITSGVFTNAGVVASKVADLESMGCNAGERFDNGDAPSSYGSAWHRIPVFQITPHPLYLGDNPGDDDSYTVNSTNADNDDNDGIADEDGVFLAGTSTSLQGATLVQGTNNLSLDVVANSGSSPVTGYLQAWVDFNGDGDFNDIGEQIATNQSLVTGNTGQLVFNVPAGAQLGNTYVRVRYSTEQDLNPSDDLTVWLGEADDGEVEDYAITIAPQDPSYNMVKTSDTATISAPGTINYTFTFTNTGNIELSNLNIVDLDATVSGCPITTLAVGAVASCTGTRSISQTQINAGTDITNTAIPSAEDPNGDSVTEDEINDNTVVTTIGRIINIGDVSVTETHSGTVNADFPVTLNAPALVDTTVTFTVADGTGTIGDADYVAPTTLSVVIPAGDTTATIVVPVNGDTTVEADETFTVTLQTTDNGTIGTAVGTGTIINDDQVGPTGTVEGIVYEDTNGNGSQDPGELGISGVSVVITESDGDTQTLTTNTNGHYSTLVTIGNTTIDIQESTLPGGSIHTEGTDTTLVNVPTNDIASDIDGYQPATHSGEVIGIVYADTNGNGMQDSTEVGISGVQIIVTDSTGNNQTLTTDSSGTYGATVPTGSTIIDVIQSTLPVGSIQTEGSDTTTVIVPINGTATDRDGFNTPIVAPLLGTVQGVIYLDANNNGQQDNGESGIPNITVNITDSNGSILTVVTNGNGQYSQAIITGSATIDIVDTDLNTTLIRSQGSDPTVVTVIAGSVANDIDGFAPPQPKPPVAVDDSKLNQSLGQIVTVKTVTNDSDPDNNLDPTTVKLRDPSGNPVTTLFVVGEGTWSVDSMSGDITFIPETGFLGDPTPVQYTVKDTTGLDSNRATVTIDYEEPAAIIGTVWLDRDKDNEIDSNEDRKAGWTLKIKDKEGNVIATTVTDAQGNYSVTGLIPDEYTVEFFNTQGTLIATQSTEGTLTAGETMDLPLPIDPSGVVYDSITREVLSGVTLQLLNSQGIPVDAACLGDGQQNQVTAEDGFYAFDVYPDAHSSCADGDVYTIKVVSVPAGYFTDSSVIPPQTGVYDSDSDESNCTLDAIAGSGSCEVQGQPDAPENGQDTSYYMDFVLSSGDSNVIFNHIPLDAEISRQTEVSDDAILLSKSANKKEISIGDQLYYTVRAENTTEAEIEVDVRDDLPKGFKFVSKVAKLTRAGEDNTFGTDDDTVSTISVTGTDRVSFAPLTLQGNEKVQIGYILKVGSAAAQGNGVNTVQVFASGSEDDIAGNIATATVAIVADSVLDQSSLIGKVFHDRDGDGYQDPANVTDLTVKSDYFGWNGLNLGGVDGRVSVLDEPAKYRKIIHMPLLTQPGMRNDFKVITQQGTVITVDSHGKIHVDHTGQKKKGLTGQDIQVTTRRIKGIPTQTDVIAMRVPSSVTDVLEITITNYGIHEEGLPGVRLATVDGLLIETDGYGRYHLPDVEGGRRGWGKNITLKVDTATLPRGSRFTTENPRVLRMTSSALNKINFGVKLPVKQQLAPSKSDFDSKTTVKSGSKVGGDFNKIVRVELGTNFFIEGTHTIKPEQMSNIQLLADNIKQHGRAEITINDSDNAQQAIQRVRAIRHQLYQMLGSQMMKNVSVLVATNRHVAKPVSSSSFAHDRLAR